MLMKCNHIYGKMSVKIKVQIFKQWQVRINKVHI